MFWQQKTFGKLFIDVKLNIFYLYAPKSGTVLLKRGVYWGFVINQFEVLYAACSVNVTCQWYMTSLSGIWVFIYYEPVIIDDKH